ncbi:MAG: hypothetical protein QF733_03635 [Phycisphaerales bacterium]|jgi:hypothetical protein|nr:hypothetical protein [Phycisphaerales bacterium]
MSGDPDQLVTLTTATSEFTAHLLLAILEDGGIEAFTFGSTGTTLGVTGQSTNPRWGVPVQVRRQDLDRARATLQANRRDSVDIDWDMVDVGAEVVDSRRHAAGPPVAARVAWLVAVTLVVIGLLAAAIVLAT